MKTNKNASIVSCPPCGENVALATKRGAYKAFSLISPSIGPADHFLRKGGRKGFTLIELLVVVLIIGILAAVAVPQYQKAVDKAHLAKYMPLVKSIYEAEEAYFLANGEYTASFNALDINVGEKCTSGSTQYGSYYLCPEFKIGIYNGTNVQIQIKKMAYLQFFDDFTEGGVDFKKGDIACHSATERAREICHSLGPGSEQEYVAGNWKYTYLLGK